MSTTSAPPAFRLARRLETVGFSDIVQIRNKVMDLRAQGRQVHQFEGGEPYMPTPQHIKDAMMQALKENKTRYAPSSGIMELRTAIRDKVRERNHIQAEVEDVLVVNGGMQGLFGAFQVTLDPGDEALMFSPYWMPIKDLIHGCQAKPVYIGTENARVIGITRALEQAVTPRTRVIYYNTPQNPSGVVFTRKEAEEVAAFAKERDLIVIADEAYEDLVYDGEHVSIASLPGMAERTITSFTLSKSYAMTGWRVGYVIAKEPWMTGLRKTTLYSTNGVSTPSQWAALAAIQTPLADLAKACDQYRERRDLIISGFDELGLTCPAPHGAFYAFPDVTRIDRDSRKAAATLYSTNGVSTPSQWAALAAIQTPLADLQKAREQYRERRDLIIKGFEELGLTCPAPHGAFYAFPDVTRIDRDSRKAAATLLDVAQVATVPGIVFGDAGEGHCRFSFSKEKEEITAMLASLKTNL